MKNNYYLNIIKVNIDKLKMPYIIQVIQHMIFFKK